MVLSVSRQITVKKGIPGGVVTPPPTGTDSTFITAAQIASLSTTSPAALRAKALADGVKNGTYVGGSAASTATDIQNVDNRVGSLALTTAIWWKLTGDNTYLAPLQTFILASPKPPDTASSPLFHHRAHGGLFAAVDILQVNGQWSNTFTLPNYNNVTWTEYTLGGSTYPTPLSTRQLSTVGRPAWQSMRGCCIDSANNWGSVARWSYLMYSVATGNQTGIAESVNMVKKYLGDQTTGLADYNSASDYIASWNNWPGAPTTGGGYPLMAGVGKTDAANPGLDGVIIDDINRGVTGYNATANFYGATGTGITYPLEAAGALWGEVGALLNLGYNPRTWGEGSNALARMGARFNRVAPADTTSQFQNAESQFSYYNNHRWLAGRINQTTYGTPPATGSGTGSIDRTNTFGDWLAASDSLWGL